MMFHYVVRSGETEIMRLSMPRAITIDYVNREYVFDDYPPETLELFLESSE